jgi:hypothetical protein
MRSMDERFVTYLSSDYPLEKVLVGGKFLRRSSFVGMGTPIVYLLSDEPPYLAISFTFPPDERVMERIVQSAEPTGSSSD